MKANDYITNCLNGIQLDGIKISSENIKITALSSSYNSEKTIKATITSIQKEKNVRYRNINY